MPLDLVCSFCKQHFSSQQMFSSHVVDCARATLMMMSNQWSSNLTTLNQNGSNQTTLVPSSHPGGGGGGSNRLVHVGPPLNLYFLPPNALSIPTTFTSSLNSVSSSSPTPLLTQTSNKQSPAHTHPVSAPLQPVHSAVNSPVYTTQHGAMVKLSSNQIVERFLPQNSTASSVPRPQTVSSKINTTSNVQPNTAAQRSTSGTKTNTPSNITLVQPNTTAQRSTSGTKTNTPSNVTPVQPNTTAQRSTSGTKTNTPSNVTPVQPNTTAQRSTSGTKTNTPSNVTPVQPNTTAQRSTSGTKTNTPSNVTPVQPNTTAQRSTSGTKTNTPSNVTPVQPNTTAQSSTSGTKTNTPSNVTLVQPNTTAQSSTSGTKTNTLSNVMPPPNMYMYVPPKGMLQPHTASQSSTSGTNIVVQASKVSQTNSASSRASVESGKASPNVSRVPSSDTKPVTASQMSSQTSLVKIQSEKTTQTQGTLPQRSKDADGMSKIPHRESKQGTKRPPTSLTSKPPSAQLPSTSLSKNSMNVVQQTTTHQQASNLYATSPVTTVARRVQVESVKKQSSSLTASEKQLVTGATAHGSTPVNKAQVHVQVPFNKPSDGRPQSFRIKQKKSAKNIKAKHKMKRKFITDSPKFIPPLLPKQRSLKPKGKVFIAGQDDFGASVSSVSMLSTVAKTKSLASISPSNTATHSSLPGLLDSNSGLNSDTNDHASSKQHVDTSRRPHPQGNTPTKEIKMTTVSQSGSKSEDVTGHSLISAPTKAKTSLNVDMLNSVLEQSLPKALRTTERGNTKVSSGSDMSDLNTMSAKVRRSDHSLTGGTTMEKPGGTHVQLGPNYHSAVDDTLRSTLASLTPVKAYQAKKSTSDCLVSVTQEVTQSDVVSQPVAHLTKESQFQSPANSSTTTVGSKASSVANAGGMAVCSLFDETLEMELKQCIFKGMEEILQKTSERADKHGNRNKQAPVTPQRPTTAKKTSLLSPHHQRKVERVLEPYRKQSTEHTTTDRHHDTVQSSHALKLSNTAANGDHPSAISVSANESIQRTVQDSTKGSAVSSENQTGSILQEPVVIQQPSHAAEALLPRAILTDRHSVPENNNDGDTCNWLNCTKPVHTKRLCSEHVKLMDHVETSFVGQSSPTTKSAVAPKKTTSNDNSTIFFGDIVGAPSLGDKQSPSDKDSTTVKEEVSNVQNKDQSSPMNVSGRASSDEFMATTMGDVEELDTNKKERSSSSSSELYVDASKTGVVKRKHSVESNSECSSPVTKKAKSEDTCISVSGKRVFGFVSEISQLNEKEKHLQEELIDVQSRLSTLNTSKEEILEEIDRHEVKNNELQTKVSQIIREIQQVLAKKQNLLSSPDMNTDIVSTMRSLSDKEHTLQQKWVEANEEISKNHEETMDLKKSLKEVEASIETLDSQQRQLMATYRSVLEQKQDLLMPSSSSVSTSKSSRLSNQLDPSRHITVTKQPLSKIAEPSPPLSVQSPSTAPRENVSIKTVSKSVTTSSVAARPEQASDQPSVFIPDNTSSLQKQSVSPADSARNVPTESPLPLLYMPLQTSSPRIQLQRLPSPSLLPKHKRPNIDGSNLSSAAVDDTSQPVSITSKSDNTSTGNTSSTSDPVTFVPHSESVLSIVKHGNNLFTCSYDNNIHIYNSQNGDLLQSLQYHKKTVTCLELYENDTKVYLLSGSSDKTLHMYDIHKGKKYAEFNLRVRVMCMCVCGDLLFAGLSSGWVQLLNLKKRCFLNKQQCSNYNSSISSVCVSSTLNLFCTASFDNEVICWNVSKSESLDEEDYHILRKKKLKFKKTVLCVLIHNHHLYAACGDQYLYMYDIKTLSKVRSFQHQDAVSSIRVIGTVLVSASFDKLVRCFEAEKLELLQAYAGFNDKIFSMCVADGNIYTGLMNGTVQSTKLDLTVYYTCKWSGCGMRFGVLDHLKEWHVKEHACVPESSSHFECKWEGCCQTLPPQLELLQEHLTKHVDQLIIK